MEVDKSDFNEQLPKLLELIEESDFVAIDFEYSGITNDSTRGFFPGKVARNRRPTLAERYSTVREAADRYCILQMGLCFVKWHKESTRYVTKPYNINIGQYINHRLGYDRIFSFTSDAITFHIKHGFDFNKLYKTGCHYLSHAEEERVRELRVQRHESLDEDVYVDEDEIPLLNSAKAIIKEWDESDRCNTASYVNVASLNEDQHLNGYQRRLLHQMVRAEFPHLVGYACDRYFQVARYDEEREQKIRIRKDKEFDQLIEAQRGARLLIDKIMELKKPLVGHNLFTDLCYMYRQFIRHLPESLDDYREILRKDFGMIIDTKFLAVNLDHSAMGDVSSSLQNLTGLLYDQQIPRIVDEYLGIYSRGAGAQDHVAGYDAWNTARAMVKLSTLMLYAGSDNPPMPKETSAALDQRKKEIAAALAVRPPRSGIARLVELENTPEKARIPHWTSKFWKVFGGRLRVNGTVEGEFTISV